MDEIDMEEFAGREYRRHRRQQYLASVTDKMKERKLSRAEIGRQTGRSGSHIGQILLGNYPYNAGWYWPKYFDEWVEFHLGIVSP